MKRKHLISAIAIIIILAVAGSSVAYFSSKDRKPNVFVMGNVKIDLTEDKWNPGDDHVIGASVKFDKNPVVKNIGDNPAYVRIRVNISDYKALKLAIGDAEPDTLFKTGDGSGSIDTAKWTKTGGSAADPDGSMTYIYTYNDELDVESSTGALFDKVVFPSATNADGLNDGFKITIQADAIQSEGFDSADKAFEAFDDNA